VDIFDIVYKEDDEQLIIQMVTEVLKEAAKAFMDMRIREGENLCRDMLARNSLIRDELDRIEKFHRGSGRTQGKAGAADKGAYRGCVR
jgi:uncharacterized protein YicC (UPF0701 family)